VHVARRARAAGLEIRELDNGLLVLNPPQSRARTGPRRLLRTDPRARAYGCRLSARPGRVAELSPVGRSHTGPSNNTSH
jgi:hypothetical protein